MTSINSPSLQKGFTFRACSTEERSRQIRAIFGAGESNFFKEENFKIGFQDLDADRFQDYNEKTQFFKEIEIGGQRYAIVLEPTANAKQFNITLHLKGADGTFSRDPLLTQYGVSVKSAEQLRDAIESSKTALMNLHFSGGTGQKTGDRYGSWTPENSAIGSNVRQHKRVFADWGKGGNSKDDGPGSWGGFGGKNRQVAEWRAKNFRNIGGGAWVNDVQGGTGWVKVLTPHEDYVRGLFGEQESWNTDLGTYIGSRHSDENCYFLNIAERNGLTIHSDMKIGDQEVMGGTFNTTEGVSVTMYWDSKSQRHKIAKATYEKDGQTYDVTGSVLEANQSNSFGKTWESIKGAIEIPKKLSAVPVGSAKETEYDEDFNAIDSVGSALVTTEEENNRYRAFLSEWGLLLNAMGEVQLPQDKAQRKRFLQDLLGLNPRHLLEFFCGDIPGAPENLGGLDKFTALLASIDLSPTELKKVSQHLGKLAHLAGDGLATSAGKNLRDSSIAEKNDYFMGLIEKVGEILNSTVEAHGKEMDRRQRALVLANFTFGLQNFSAKGKGWSELEPQQAVAAFVRDLGSKANMTNKDYDPSHALKMIEFADKLTQAMDQLVQINHEFLSDWYSRSDNSISAASAINSRNLGKYSQLQKIHGVTLSVLQLASGSKEAKDTYTTALQQKSSEYTALQSEFLRAIREFVDRTGKLAEAVASITR